MQVPVLSGITTDPNAEWRASYPLNLMPVARANGVSNGYLRTVDGLKLLSAPTGKPDRGGFRWRDKLYRVLYDQLVRVSASGAKDELGAVAYGTARARFAYSFDHMAVASGGRLYLFDGGVELKQVTDPDLGTVIDVVWLDGRFMTTDGTYLINTELDDSFAVDPLKYGSSEVSPDGVTGLEVVGSEIASFGRYTVEFFQVTAGTGFPYQRIESAMVRVGCISAQAKCPFLGTVAFVGSAENEPLSLYLLGAGRAQSIATREIETLLKSYSEEVLTSDLVLEARSDKVHKLLYLHLPGVTMVYDAAATEELGQPAWFRLGSGVAGDKPYRARGYVWCYDRWTCGDALDGRIGEFTQSTPAQYGERAAWEFDTVAIYNEGRGAIVHEIELVRLAGRVSPTSKASAVYAQWSDDGQLWSNPRVNRSKPGLPVGKTQWFNAGMLSGFRTLRFHGDTDAPESVTRLDLRLEGLR